MLAAVSASNLSIAGLSQLGEAYNSILSSMPYFSNLCIYFQHNLKDDTDSKREVRNMYSRTNMLHIDLENVPCMLSCAKIN